jgi:hypothetical protein
MENLTSDATKFIRNRPTHILYESLPGQLLVVQPLLFMIAIFLAFGAFKKYTNIQQILAIKPPQGESHWVLDWADSVLDQPIFPQMSADGPTDKIQSATSFHDQLRRLSERSGMENHVTIHSGRREALIIATGIRVSLSSRRKLFTLWLGLGYPKDELTKFAAHTNPNTLATSYLSSMSSVDGLAGYLGLPLRSDQVEDFRTLTVSRNPDLLLSLPAKEHDELRQSSEWISIDNELKELSGRTLDAETKALASTLKGKLRKLERAKLIEARRNRVRIHPSERQGPLREDRDRSKWKRIQHLIPERDELSKLLFTQAPLRSEEGISAVNYLISLLKTSTKTAYQPSFRPTAKGECPVPGCSVLLERYYLPSDIEA